MYLLTILTPIDLWQGMGGVIKSDIDGAAPVVYQWGLIKLSRLDLGRSCKRVDAINVIYIG